MPLFMVFFTPLSQLEWVPRAGLEPAQPKGRGILNPLVSTDFTTWAFMEARPESNRGTRICNPLHDHSANALSTAQSLKRLERETRLELATPTLARLCSTN